MSSRRPWRPPSSSKSWKHATGATPPRWRPAARARGLRAGAHPRRRRHGQRGRQRHSGYAAGRNRTAAARRPAASRGRALAALPGGSANVFAGALGLPRDPVDATGQILQALDRGPRAHHRPGHGRRPVLHVQLRARPRRRGGARGPGPAGARPAGHARRCTSGWRCASSTGRPTGSHPAHAGSSGQDGRPEGPVFLGIVSNTAPWTYLGGRQVNANPRARFDTGLDVFALRSMSSFSTFYALGQMLTTTGGAAARPQLLTLHDQPAVTLRPTGRSPFRSTASTSASASW